MKTLAAVFGGAIAIAASIFFLNKGKNESQPVQVHLPADIKSLVGDQPHSLNEVVTKYGINR